MVGGWTPLKHLKELKAYSHHSSHLNRSGQWTLSSSVEMSGVNAAQREYPDVADTLNRAMMTWWVSVCNSGCESHGKNNYSWTEIMTDLLQFAAQYLTLNGRLAFWLPVHRQQYVVSIAVWSFSRAVCVCYTGSLYKTGNGS